MKYLHIGGGENLRTEEIIGIFDLDTATVSKVTKKFINQKTKEGRVKFYDADLPRSFILTKEGLSLSRISPAGLCQRIRDGAYDKEN